MENESGKVRGGGGGGEPMEVGDGERKSGDGDYALMGGTWRAP